MAIRTGALITTGGNIHVRGFKWLGLLNGDNGDGMAQGWWKDRCVQVFGTFGAGGSISLQGSNDGGTTWAILTDQAGAALTFTAAGIKTVAQATLLTRPIVTAGDGTTTLACYLAMVGAYD